MKYYKKRTKKYPKSTSSKPKRVYAKNTLTGQLQTLASQVRTIKRRVETKTLQYPIGESSLGPYYNMGDQFVVHQLSSNISTLPIPQNTHQGGRIGNRIYFTSGKIKLNFWAAPYDAEVNPYPQPCIVVIYLITRRDSAQGAPTASLPNFYQSGSTSIAPAGYLPDTFNEVNKDAYVVYKKYTVKIGASINTGTGNAPSLMYWANNDFSLNKSLTIDFTKHLVRNPKFNDASTNEPVDRGLWMVMEAVSATNTGMAVGQMPVKYLAEISLKYTDT